MKISDLRQFTYFRDRRDVKVARHKEPKKDLWELFRQEKFGHYQEFQSWDVFKGAKYILSFIGERDKYAKFVGVWEILSSHKRGANGFRYSSREIKDFNDLKGRLVVQWGKGTRSWTQWLHTKGDKEIVELLPPNYVMDFPGYYDFTLTYDQLSEIVNDPKTHREWQRMLSSVCGVYLVLDRRSGKQYIGSAYGTDGIWARWKKYVKTPSGGNKMLRELLRGSCKRHKHFQFSILRVLEPNARRGDVIAAEVCSKRKLGSRAFGLNSN